MTSPATPQAAPQSDEAETLLSSVGLGRPPLSTKPQAIRYRNYYNGVTQIRSHTWLYDSIIDVIMSEPTAGLARIAEVLGKSANFVSHITKSDSFKLYYEKRRALVNDQINESIGQKLGKLAVKGIDMLDEKITANPKSISFDQAAEMVDKLVGRLGFGQSPVGNSVQVNVNAPQVVASPEDLAAARATLLLVNQRAAAAPLPPSAGQRAPSASLSPQIEARATRSASVPLTPSSEPVVDIEYDSEPISIEDSGAEGHSHD